MAAANQIAYLFLAYLSKPASDRKLYRLIRRRKVKRIVEVGLGNGRRALRMIRLAQGAGPGSAVSYTGIDLFELRPAATPGLPLKQAYRLLRASGARIRLVPGDPFAALARAANNLTGTDLVVISADQDPAALQQAWFYVPRMLHAESQVMVETESRPGVPSLELLQRAAVAQRASTRLLRAA